MHFNINYKYKMVEQWVFSWYQSACFFLIKASGRNIELRVKSILVGTEVS